MDGKRDKERERIWVGKVNQSYQRKGYEKREERKEGERRSEDGLQDFFPFDVR